MSFAKVSRNKEDIEQSSGGKYITKSGMYPVHIIAPVVNISKNGSTSVDMFVEFNGQEQIVYGSLRVTNNDDSTNEIGAKIFNQLMIIGGIEDELDDPEEVELPIGKKGKMEDSAVLTELSDIDVIMRVQMEYGSYMGNITEKKVIKGFYRAEDKATAEEMVNKSEAGVTYAKDLEYAGNVTYKDEVSEEQITEWIKAKRPSGTAGGGSGASSATAAKKPSFKKKRFNTKKADA